MYNAETKWLIIAVRERIRVYEEIGIYMLFTKYNLFVVFLYPFFWVPSWRGGTLGRRCCHHRSLFWHCLHILGSPRICWGFPRSGRLICLVALKYGGYFRNRWLLGCCFVNSRVILRSWFWLVVYFAEDFSQTCSDLMTYLEFQAGTTKNRYGGEIWMSAIFLKINRYFL